MRFSDGHSLLLADSPALAPFGKLLDGDFGEAIELLNGLPLPAEGNVYSASFSAFEALPLCAKTFASVFSATPLQAGYCLGRGRKMNGFEWHSSPEIILAATDMVLLLGLQKDIKCGRYNSADCTAFYLKKGLALMLLPEVLHLAPLAVEDSFRAGIVLPRGTNLPLTDGTAIQPPLRAANKWLIVHPEHTVAVQSGALVAVTGDNITLINDENA